ncbi:transcriptional regulator [Nostoc sp. NIES-2111]|nr:transcriptional regulator [Nostoc sp. NIES-2111]
MATTQQASTKQEILEYLLKHSQATALELATILEVSPQAIRRHLKDLEAEELVVYSNTTHAGMGRPQHVYQLSRQGRERLHKTASDGLRPTGGDRHGDFAVSLLDTIAETVGHDQFKTILQKQWQRKALEYRDRVGNGSLRERVANLVELRKAEGFMAEYHPVDSPNSSEDERFIFMEHNCAISNVAESFPSVCGHELEMFAAVLPDCLVERTHWLINGEHRCGYLVQPRNQASHT